MDDYSESARVCNTTNTSSFSCDEALCHVTTSSDEDYDSDFSTSTLSTSLSDGEDVSSSSSSDSQSSLVTVYRRPRRTSESYYVEEKRPNTKDTSATSVETARRNGKECDDDHQFSRLAGVHRPFDEQSRIFEQWRGKALEFLVRSPNVFILEVYMVWDFVLQVKMSTDEVALSINTSPWSMSSGSSVSDQEFRKIIGRCDPETEVILGQRSGVFSPPRLVRFVLNHCNSVPAIVSSNYTNLLKRSAGESKFMEYFVYQKLVPGSQRCSREECRKMATTVQLDVTLSPKAIYCSRHARELEIDDKVLLYNPLLVAFTPHKKTVVISALNVAEVYGPRFGYWSTLPENDKPIPLPMRWTPICRKTQPRQLDTKKPIDTFFVTAKNVLNCADEHFRRGKHFVGVDVRHSLTRCLLKTFLFNSGIISLCDLSSTDVEDLPYNWSVYHRL